MFQITAVRLKVEENQLVGVFGEICVLIDALKGRIKWAFSRKAYKLASSPATSIRGKPDFWFARDSITNHPGDRANRMRGLSIQVAARRFAFLSSGSLSIGDSSVASALELSKNFQPKRTRLSCSCRPGCGFPDASARHARARLSPSHGLCTTCPRQCRDGKRALRLAR